MLPEGFFHRRHQEGNLPPFSKKQSASLFENRGGQARIEGDCRE